MTEDMKALGKRALAAIDGALRELPVKELPDEQDEAMLRVWLVTSYEIPEATADILDRAEMLDDLHRLASSHGCRAEMLDDGGYLLRLIHRAS